MSYELDIREELIIQNVNAKTRTAAQMLADYIRQFDRMDGLSGMQIYSMELEADGQIAYADDEISTKECGYIFTDDADGSPRVKLIEEDYSHWDDEEDVAVILTGLEEARKIILRMDCSLQVASETSYGVAYWQSFLQNMDADGFGENVNYRSAEFYTAEDPVCCYSYQNGRGTVQKFDPVGAEVAGSEVEGSEAASEACSTESAGGSGAAGNGWLKALDEQSWYSYCLNMSIGGEFGSAGTDDAAVVSKNVELCQKLAELVDDFSAKYDLETTWETMQSLAEGSVYSMTEELGLLAGEASGFMADLQKFADLAAEYGAEFRLRGEFFADNGDFQFMSIGVEEGNVQAKYCKF